MHDLYKQLRDDYIAELRAIAPDIRRWWAKHCPYAWTEPTPREAMSDFHLRWPMGPAGHPRIVEVFRRYYFAVWALNERFAAERRAQPPQPLTWGTDSKSEAIDFERPLDLLMYDLANVAPDLFEIMEGFIYVPIGMTLYGEEC